jgi:hypothetical protein
MGLNINLGSNNNNNNSVNGSTNNNNECNNNAQQDSKDFHLVNFSIGQLQLEIHFKNLSVTERVLENN